MQTNSTKAWILVETNVSNTSEEKAWIVFSDSGDAVECLLSEDVARNGISHVIEAFNLSTNLKLGVP